MEIGVVLLLLVIGVLLLLVEFFLIPGITIAGIAGLVFLIGGVVYAYVEIGADAGHLTILGAMFIIAFAVWLFIKTKTLEKLSLKTEIKSKNDPLAGMHVKEGDEGITISRLAPMGKIKVAGQVMEAKSPDEFIDEGTIVVVKKVLLTNVIVERKENV
jgi:membrane-bound ClpP family serine protease